MKKHIKRLHEGSKRAVRKGLRRPPKIEDIIPDAMVPRITNETIAVHREEVLAGARKYIYPLQHAKHRIISITAALLVGGVIAFFAYCTLALYRFHSTSSFMYRVTQVIPFPVARADGQFISYE